MMNKQTIKPKKQIGREERKKRLGQALDRLMKEHGKVLKQLAKE